MSYAITWGGDPEDLTITFSGPVATAEVLAAFDELRSSPAYHGSLRILQDHRAADWSEVTADDIRKRAEAIVANTAEDERHRVAVVVDRQLGFGLMRIREAHMDGRIPTTDRVFYDLDAARDWLRE